ncbi:GntR family transcriptional regulator, partial [Micromonospora sp. NPDC049580]|uniref:GntR family transcriptional regulator n=2 Tax=Micromonospora TaxID=1873 RepID=UPI00342B6172
AGSAAGPTGRVRAGRTATGGRLVGVNDMAASTVDGELESVSLVDLAVSRLTREILSGKSDPGERLVEEQLTRRLGISRAPLREALRLLAQQGLVEHVPRRGVRVATLSDRDVRELYELRDVLERFSVRAGIPVGRESDLAGLRATLDQMREATRAGDRMTVAESHRAFHVALVALAGNRQLSAVYGSILVKLQLYMAINLRREAEVAQPLDGVHRHERLFEAVVGGDPEEVLAVLSAHGARSYLD